MSVERVEKVTCPKCGCEADFTVWNSLNTSVHPDGKEKLLNGELFHFTCPDCGTMAEINYPMIYHQMEDRIMIHLVFDQDGYELAYQSCSGERSGCCVDHDFCDYMDKAMDGYLFRIVTSHNSLMEKVRIFDAGKDDRILEMIKVVVAGNLRKKYPELGDFALYYVRDDSMENFVLVGDGKVYGTVPVPEGLYEEIAGTVGDRLPDLRDRKSLLIDSSWAAEFMKELSE